MINKIFEMKKSEHLLWLFGGIIIGTAAGAAAAATAGSSKALSRLRSQITHPEFLSGQNTEKLKRSIRSEASEFAKRIRKQISSPVPDLYKATENITIEQPEIIYGW